MPLRTPLGRALLAAAVAAAFPAAVSADPRVDARIVQGMERSFAGDWAEARATFASIREIDPTHPAWALYPATVDYWEMHEDYSSPAYYPPIFAALEKAAQLAEARAERDPKDAEALAYWGYALVHMGRHKAFLGDYMGGGATGEEGRGKLERALELRPDYADAECPLGSYNYLAGSLPSVAKAFDFLWFVPKGDKARGLAHLDACRSGGRVHRLEADLLLFNILGRYESARRAEALEIGRTLRDRFPRNAAIHIDLPRLLLEIGETEAALAEVESVLAKVREGASTYDRKIEALALFWKARAHMIARDYDAADETMRGLAALEPARPLWLPAWALVTKAQLQDLRGRRSEAVALYRAVSDLKEEFRSPDAVEEAELRIDEPYRTPAL